ncbi:MAG: hypothetical protein H7X79_03070 [Sporomusaceae bacterium]|nr:hypothetical protein [Sporomusaceae bacterium]
MVDTVAQSLAVVSKQLDKNNIKYITSMTRPTRTSSILDKDSLYVIRQQIDADGVYHLIVAASMGQEKWKTHGL